MTTFCRARFAPVLALVTLAGCGGGGSASVTPTPTSTPPGSSGGSPATATVRAVLVIPAGESSRAARGRGRQYVAPLPSTKGLIVVVQRKTSAGTTTLSATGYDLTGTSPGSPCTASATTTTCTIAIDAPVTSSAAHDVFSLYAYDAVQTAGALPSGYAVAGNLLSQDDADEVPAASGPNSGTGIVSGVVNTPTFVLRPVVAAPVASIGGATAQPLTLSAPGTGGQTNALLVRGNDADGNPIATYLAGAGDDAYVNPLGIAASTTTGGGTLTPAQTTVTSATAAAIQFTYVEPMLIGSIPAPPTSPSSTPPSGTATLTASLADAGYAGESSQAAATENIGVAPLFAVADAPVITTSGFSSNVYALQSAIPTSSTAASYTLTQTPAASDDCSAYPATFTQGTGATPPQQAVFALATTSAPTGTCTFTLSDGISNVTIVFNPNGTHNP